MECLGINKFDGTVYEGRLNIGFRSSPAPVLIPISFPDENDQSAALQGTFAAPVDGYAPMLFREDSFEPITKIRRGRVFRLRSCTQPFQWHVQDPLRSDLETISWAGGHSQCIQTLFYERASLTFFGTQRMHGKERLVILGSEPFVSLWKVASIENTAHGTPILTLRAYRSLDALPEVVQQQVPEPIRTTLNEALGKVEASSHQLGAVAVVDRCRDALSVIFGNLCGKPGEDLGPALRILDANQQNPYRLACWCGHVVARLHSRGKPNEQLNHGTRPLTEEDAELAIGCLGLVLKEIGWGKKE